MGLSSDRSFVYTPVSDSTMGGRIFVNYRFTNPKIRDVGKDESLSLEEKMES